MGKWSTQVKNIWDGLMRKEEVWEDQEGSLDGIDFISYLYCVWVKLRYSYHELHLQVFTGGMGDF